MKHHIKDGDRLIATIETHGQAVVVAHEPTEKPKTNLLYPEGLEAVVKDGEMQNEEPAQDYSHLIGKWFQCICTNSVFFKLHNWYRCIGNPNEIFAFIDSSGDPNGFVGDNHIYFDLSNPRDTNPDEIERIIPFDIERWRTGDFVQTRDGREVEQLKEYDCTLTPLVGIIKGQAGVSCWSYNGNYGNLSYEHSHDLMLVIKGEGGVK
jgi:hypothetical protein